jgi:membrane protease YdiL (CAAX protease family)
VNAPRPAPARWPVAVWVVIALGAAPVAWGLAALGVTIPIGTPWRDVAGLVLWSVAEEIVFRGGVQTALSRQPVFLMRDGLRPHAWCAITAANAATSLLFCAAHLWNKPATIALGLFPVSLLLGASLERSGRLVVPVALHAYFNLLLYAASWLLAR